MNDATLQENSLPVSRKEAMAIGSKHYFTGKPCKSRHLSKRLISGACCECLRDAYKRNADKINEKLRAAYAESPELQAAAKERKSRSYRALRKSSTPQIRNREREKEASRRWRAENKERARETRRLYKQNRRAADPSYVMLGRMQVSINRAIRVGGYTKRSRTYEYLGCSFEEFKRHIERQFLKGMTWDNRDLWHVDHIVPNASASTEAELFALQHYTNLRPLWAGANRAKSDSREFLI